MDRDPVFLLLIPLFLSFNRHIHRLSAPEHFIAQDIPHQTTINSHLQTTVASQSTFHHFPKLPVEVQNAIWQFALEDKPVIRHCFSIFADGEQYQRVYSAYTSELSPKRLYPEVFRGPVTRTIKPSQTGELSPWEEMIKLPGAVKDIQPFDLPENLSRSSIAEYMLQLGAGQVFLRASLERDIFHFTNILCTGHEGACHESLRFLYNPIKRVEAPSPPPRSLAFSNPEPCP